MQESHLVLSIDLKHRTSTVAAIDPAIMDSVSGGRGYNVWYLLKHLPSGADPLGPENILLFSCGLLTGTAAPAAARLHISGLSPQTRLLGSSNIGGEFGARLRAAGYLSLIVRGKSPDPVLLVIDQDRVRLVAADSYWGLDTWQTRERIACDFGPNAQALCIGPAGENQVRFACIMNGLDHAAGRTGLGAVMGSKNFKGVVIAGSGSGKPKSSGEAREAARCFVRKIKESPYCKEFSRHGGAGSVPWCNDLGIMPGKNFQKNRFQGAKSIDGRLLTQQIQRWTSCHRCPIGCKAELKTSQETSGAKKATRPEFESMVNLGARCGLSDINAVVHLDNLCNRLGLDCISAAGVMAFAMELFEKNILSLEDTQGLDLSWGRAAVMEELLQQITDHKGLGRYLALGVKEASRLIKGGSEAFAYEVKGLELSAYHPREIKGTALGYAVSSRGGDFNTLYASLEYNWTEEQALEAFGTKEGVDLKSTNGKGKLIKRAAIVNAVLDCLGLCKLPTLSLLADFSLELEAGLCSGVRGDVLTAQDLFTLGERVINLERLFNHTQGASHLDDTLPDFFFQTETGRKNWLEPMVQDFYREMGWDQEGNPVDPILEYGFRRSSKCCKNEGDG